MDNDQRQSWWPDEHSSNSHPAPRKESPLPEENLTEQHQEQQTFEEYSTEQYQNQNNFSNQRSRFPSGNGMVTASMIMGIISVLLICCGISYFFGALGIIFALLSRRDGPMESQAKVGLGLSIAGAVGGIILLVVTIVANFSTYQNLYQELEKYYLEDNYDEYEDFFDNYDNYLEEFNQNDSVHSDSGNSHVFLDL
ncbi:MAG: hypothetical protein ACI4DX_04585 [Oliverpabstia sp.]|nr:DUF4064 domain-containing protein [Eubacterium sp.]